MASKPRAVCLLLVSLALFQGAVHCQITASDHKPLFPADLPDLLRAGMTRASSLSDAFRMKIEESILSLLPQIGGEVVEVVDVFTSKIIGAVNELITALVSAILEPLSDDDAREVVAALVAWAEAQKNLSHDLFELHELAGFRPFYDPIRLKLEQVEVVEVEFTSNLLNFIPTQQLAASEQVASLITSIHTAVETYSAPPFKTALRKQAF